MPTFLFALALASSAFAQTEATLPDIAPFPEGQEPLLEPDRLGITLGIGGGLGQFLDGDGAKLGGFWEVRGAFRARRLLSVELAYSGSTRSFQTAANSGAKLIGNGLETALRLQYRSGAGGWFIAPFLCAGIGWTHFAIGGGSVDNTLSPRSDELWIPLGTGVSFERSGLFIQLRGVWRQPVWTGTVTALDGRQASLQGWSIGGLLGYEF